MYPSELARLPAPPAIATSPCQKLVPAKSSRFVSVVKLTDRRKLNDPSQFRSLDGPRLRGVQESRPYNQR
jgi:hypothetical protein